MNTVFGSNPYFGRAFGRAGSLTEPTYSFFGAPLTGFFLNGTAGIVFTSNGAGSLTFDAGGRIYNSAGNSYAEFDSAGQMSFYSAAAGNKNIRLIPGGSGGVVIGTDPGGAELLRVGGSIRLQSVALSNISDMLVVGNSLSTGLALLGTTTNSGNGILQLASHTTSAGGIGFGTDGFLHRSGSYSLYTNCNLLGAGGILAAGATNGIGYATGAGGTVTQITSKATGVTLNKVCGTITTHNANLAAGAIVSFTVTNSAIAATDSIHIQHQNNGTAGAYTVNARANGAGSFIVDLRNNTAGALAEAIDLRFAVIKTVNA